MLFAVPPEADGATVTCVMHERLQCEAALVRSPAPVSVRCSWAAAGLRDLRRQANAAHMPLPCTIVFLRPGQQLGGVLAEAGRRLQRAGWGWGATPRPRALTWGHVFQQVADTDAAVVADVALLPLADYTGVPRLPLAVAEVVLEAAASGMAACSDLERVQMCLGVFGEAHGMPACLAGSRCS